MYSLSSKARPRLVASGHTLALTASTILLGACVAPFSEMQSARLAGPGRFEVTPTYATVTGGSSEGSEKVQSQFGAHAAFGVSQNLDLRVRYERIQPAGDEEGVSGVNVLAVGPKFPLVRDRLAVFVPVGMAFGGFIDESSETWQVHPTLLATIPASSRVDINGSIKALVPLNSEGAETLVAFNLGLGIGTADRKWTLRPEAGLLRNPGESGYFRHFAIGLTRGF